MNLFDLGGPSTVDLIDANTRAAQAQQWHVGPTADMPECRDAEVRELRRELAEARTRVLELERQTN